LKRILLTGATGFVGHAVYERLKAENRSLIIACRQAPSSTTGRPEFLFHQAELAKDTDWSPALKDIDTVIHAAARVHIMNDDAKDPLAEFRAVNVDGTLGLARQAADAGTRRFIFISSIKVNGEGTRLGNPYTAEDVPGPADPYGISKMEAEQGLTAIATATGMEVVIIRPVLVYGPGVKANFRSMMHWLNKSVPLPLGAIDNKRSLVAIDNLVDLIVTCIDHPAAANQIFLVSDGEDLSTTELLRRMAMALGKPARLLPVPSLLLRAGARLVGKNNIAQRLCGSLQVDIGKTRSLLEWNPPMSVDEALKRTAKSFKSSSRT